MATLKIRDVLNNVIMERPTYNVAVRNDKTKEGRSIKVERWGQADYDAAQVALEAAGYEVRQVVTPELHDSVFRGYYQVISACVLKINNNTDNK